MYYVPDGTKECGYYECKKCGNRFLSMQTMKRIPCPDCEAEIDSSQRNETYTGSG